MKIVHIDKQELGSRIRLIRGDRSQKEFARIMKCTQSHLSALELGKSSPSVDFLNRLAVVSGRSYNWLLTGDEMPTRPSRRKTSEKEPPLSVSKREDPSLYRLVAAIKKSKPKEKALFMKMALAYFEEEKKER